MFTDPTVARDEMFALFNEGWKVDTNVVALEVETRWQGKEKKDVPEGYWARVSKVTAGTEGAGFLENGQGASPQVYDNYGNIFVEVFAPMKAADSFRFGELLARAARDIFRAVETPSGVWFRNARYVELENDGKHYRFKVTVEYEFSET